MDVLDFLANNVEQLDLALEHILAGDVNNARFGLMLIDNAVEITLHQLALDGEQEARSWRYRDRPYEHAGELQAALGTNFGPKLKFARALEALDGETAETIGIAHKFRNEVYHLGLQHEAVLGALAQFYFQVAAVFLGAYSPGSLSYSVGKELPPRARKHFGEGPHFHDARERYRMACASLGAGATQKSTELASQLADHLDQIVDGADVAIETVAGGGPRKMTRDEAVLDSMAWSIAFSDEGKSMARRKGWPEGSVADYVRWIGKNCRMPLRKDPITRWRKRAESVRRESNGHAALRKYRGFMDDTGRARSVLDAAHGQVEMYIEEQIERMREERGAS